MLNQGETIRRFASGYFDRMGESASVWLQVVAAKSDLDDLVARPTSSSRSADAHAPWSVRIDRRRDLPAAALTEEPMLVTVIDGVGAFLGEFDAIENAETSDTFTRLVADGPSVGILFVLLADRTGALPLRLASSVGQRALFKLADPNDYTTIGLRRRALPAFLTGRCACTPYASRAPGSSCNPPSAPTATCSASASPAAPVALTAGRGFLVTAGEARLAQLPITVGT